MNASELADKLEKPMLDNPDCPNFSRTRGFMEQVVAMLRQQQAEIEALKQIIDANNLNQNIGQFVKPIKYSDAWWREVDEFNKQLKAQEK